MSKIPRQKPIQTGLMKKYVTLVSISAVFIILAGVSIPLGPFLIPLFCEKNAVGSCSPGGFEMIYFVIVAVFFAILARLFWVKSKNLVENPGKQ